jgi:Flp pilus assembly protein TadG
VSLQQSSLPMNTTANSKAGKGLRKAVPAEGQALIEFALVLPLLFLLIVNVVNFGGFFFAWIKVVNGSRAGAQYAVLNSGSVGSLATATGALIKTLITQDTAALNPAALTVNVCQNNNGTVTAISGTCTAPASDPEPATYILAWVDVTYQYQPFIQGFSFPRLGIYTTLPPTVIHRRTYMRVIK